MDSINRINIDTYEGSEPYIFVSYKRDDHKTVYPIVERLSEEGFRIWIDKAIKPSDEDFRSTLSVKIKGCKRFLAFYSNKYQQSVECQKEVICFLEHHLLNNIGKSIVMLGSYNDIDRESQPYLMEHFLDGANGFSYKSEADLDRLVEEYKSDPEISMCCDPRIVPLKTRLIAKRKEIIRTYYKSLPEEDQIKYSFDDDILNDLCESKPLSKDEFMAIRYLGEKKYEKFGEEVMAVIRQYINDTASLLSGEIPAPAENAAYKMKPEAAVSDGVSEYKVNKPAAPACKPMTDVQKGLAEKFRRTTFIKGISEELGMSFSEVVLGLAELSARSDCADIREKLKELAEENSAVKGNLFNLLKAPETKEIIKKSGALTYSRKGN